MAREKGRAVCVCVCCVAGAGSQLRPSTCMCKASMGKQTARQEEPKQSQVAGRRTKLESGRRCQWSTRKVMFSASSRKGGCVTYMFCISGGLQGNRSVY